MTTPGSLRSATPDPSESSQRPAGVRRAHAINPLNISFQTSALSLLANPIRLEQWHDHIVDTQASIQNQRL